MKVEFDVELLARQLSMQPSDHAVKGNLALIRVERQKLANVSEQLDKLVKATQGLCSHKETDVDLGVGLDGITICKLCGESW